MTQLHMQYILRLKIYWKQVEGKYLKEAKRQKIMFRLENQEKLRSFQLTPKYTYGVQVPRNYNHVKILNKKNKNTKWQDSTSLEMKQLDEYNTFNDLGKNEISPSGYNKIKVHLIYDIKYDTRHKAGCVADGHLEEIRVVSLRELRMVIFLAEINQLNTCATYIGNAYLEGIGSEKVCIT